MTVKVECEEWVWYEIHALQWKMKEGKSLRSGHRSASINSAGGGISSYATPPLSLLKKGENDPSESFKSDHELKNDIKVAPLKSLNLYIKRVWLTFLNSLFLTF